jgi:hypothetical protein
MALDETQEIVRRLARPHPSGGMVIERSVILAEGRGSAAILNWIRDHDGVADSSVAGARKGGLHGSRDADVLAARQDAPARRFVLPARVFD